MKRRSSLIINLLLVSVLISATPSVMALEKETLNFWEIAACPSEDIEMLGSVRFQTHFVENADHVTSVFQAFWTGDAWGLDTGAEYKIRGKWMEVVQENPPFILRWNDHFQLIGKGSAPNYSFYFRTRIVVNANGDLSVDFEDVEWPCPATDFAIW